MKAPTVTCALFLLLSKLNTVTTKCSPVPPGYYNNFGTCMQCMPCPNHHLNDYVNDDCMKAFVSCPNLCRLPGRTWKEHELYNASDCSNFGKTTLRPETTLSKDATTPVITVSKEVTKRLPDTIQAKVTGITVASPPYRELSGTESGKPQWFENKATWIIVSLLALVLIIVTISLCYMMRNRSSSSNPENKDILSNFSSETKSISADFEVPTNYDFSYKDLLVQLCEISPDGHKIVKEKPLPEVTGPITSELPVGVRPSVLNHLLCWIKKHISPVRSGHITFEACDGVLPGTNYFLKMLAGPNRIEKEKHEGISTKAWQFEAICTGGTIHLQNMHSEELNSYLQLERQPYLTNSCGCVDIQIKMTLSDLQFNLERFPSKESFFLDICFPSEHGVDCVVGKCWIEIKDPAEYSPCTCEIKNESQEFLRSLEGPLSPKSFQPFCECVIRLSNELSKDGEPFNKDLASNREITGSDFMTEYMTGFSAPHMQSIKVHELIQTLVTRRLYQKHKEAVNLLAKAVQQNHKCEVCAAHIHRELHTPDSSASNGHATRPQETSYTIENEASLPLMPMKPNDKHSVGNGISNGHAVKC